MIAALWRYIIAGQRPEKYIEHQAWATKQLLLKHCEDGSRLDFMDRELQAHREFVKKRGGRLLSFRKSA